MTSIIIYACIAIAALGAIGGFVAAERKAGADKVRAELQPKLTACEGQVSAMGEQIKQQNAAVDSLKTEADAKQATASQELAKAEGRAKIWEGQSSRLQAILASRKKGDPVDCKAAWQEIRK